MDYNFRHLRCVQKRQKKISTSCPMDFSKYPLDTQVCDVVYSTFFQSASELALTAAGGKLLDFSSVASFIVGQFTISSVTTTTSVESGSFTIITGTITAVRSSSYFWRQIFVPDLLLHICIYVNFWIACAMAPARIGIIVTSFLSFRVIMQSISADLPPVTYAIW